MQYTVEKSSTIHLGKQGEHRARELVFPELAAWEEEYGPGEAEIVFLQPGEKEPVSIAPARTEDGAWVWTVTASETVCPGYGKCELRYTAGNMVVKSATYQTYVAESVGEGTPVQKTGPETNPDSTQQENPAGIPLVIDEESGIPYKLAVEGGKLMIQEAE